MQQQRSYIGNAPSSYIPTGGGGESPPISRGPAEIIPFPVVARVGFLDRTAELAASYRDPSKYLASVYRQQESSLRRRGFPEDVVQSEMAALDRAIQSRLGEHV